jgi:hypothetical protein
MLWIAVYVSLDHIVSPDLIKLMPDMAAFKVPVDQVWLEFGRKILF